jgi:hypothetical protein
MTTNRPIMTPSSVAGEQDGVAQDPDMAERLRVVAEEPSGRRVDLLGQQPERAHPITEPLEQLARLVDAASEHEVVDPPATAQQERPFLARQPVIGHVGVVPMDEAITGAQTVHDRLRRRDHARMIGCDDLSQRQREHTRIQTRLPARGSR